MQCIIMVNTLIKLTLHNETKKRAHDSQIVRAKENLKLGPATDNDNLFMIISIWLLVGFHAATLSVQSTPADNTRKRAWQYIEKEKENTQNKSLKLYSLMKQYFGWGPSCRGRFGSPTFKGPSLLGAEFVRGREVQESNFEYTQKMVKTC